MRVLWISNILFPELCDILGIQAPFGGGWMQSAAKALVVNHTIELAIASFYGGTTMQVVKGKNIIYYLIPEHTTKGNLYDPGVENYLKVVNQDFKPDVVHIHGSESGHSLAQLRACGSEKTVVSIQGLVHFCKDFYLGGLSEREVNKSRTIRDIIRCDSLVDQQQRMEKRALLEIELLKEVKHVIGRTSWDRACVWALNPLASYHFCNETLRDSFYEQRWGYDQCCKHTIFLSQGSYPLKGLHQIIKALPLILREYPDAKVYVAGSNFFSGVPFWRKNGYAQYIGKLIEKHSVSGKVHFLGELSELQMIEQYKQAHVFVCPSAIENSPNSIGEAQLLGTPVVSSYVGGTMDMVKDNETGFLYRFEETSLLAQRVCELFANRDLCNRLSEQARIAAKQRHCKETNAAALLEIYNKMVSC